MQPNNNEEEEFSPKELDLVEALSGTHTEDEWKYLKEKLYKDLDEWSLDWRFVILEFIKRKSIVFADP